MEDKKCRLCGFADLANPSIFNSNAKFVEKIVAVFPIVLYPNDPLPKHICKKCLVSTTTMYAEIERALKNQSKWIANVRSVQPDNHYVKVVDSIEGANKQTASLVSKVAGEEIGERTVCRLFNWKTDDQQKIQNNTKHDLVAIADKIMPGPVRMELDIELPTAISIEQKKAPRQEQIIQPATVHTPAKITQLKSVLELNGCTLTKLKPTIRAAEEVEPNVVVDQIKVEIKEEPPFHEEYSEVSTVACKMCSFRCETVEELAIHQLDHLSLSVPKLAERRYLDKRVRRGRLIKIEEKKCIRCLNCWRIFVDNKSILHHWSGGDCDFFCQICGKEFATSPKMLREHIPAAHGISYRSCKLLRPQALIPRKPIKTEKSPQKPDLQKGQKGMVSNEALSVKVACNICMKVFANFKARNSHMRAHKHPPLLPAQPPPSLSDTLLAFNRSNLLPIKDEPQDYDDIPYHIVRSLDSPAASTSKVVLPCAPNAAIQPQLHPPPKIIPHSPQKVEFRTSLPSGIRTKYVKVRPNPNSIVFKTEPGIPGSQVLKVKSLVDLQDPSVSSQQPEDLDKARLRIISSAGPSGNGIPTSNGLGVAPTPKDNMNYGQIFNCHPCGGKFSSKLELFRHKRKCTANNLFPCQFCSRHFLTSADLQMHIMLLHKNSNSAQ